MSGGGGKGGKSQQSIDPRLSAASAKLLERADVASKLPYAPNRGVTIAAFTPQQEAAMEGAAAAADAFGIPGGGRPVMPKKEVAANGIEGYSTGSLYDEMIAKSISPELKAAIDSMFSIKPNAGTAGSTGKSRGLTLQDAMMRTMGMKTNRNSGAMAGSK